MFVYLPELFKKFFSHLVANAKRRSEARYAERAARRRLARFAHPRLEILEERELLDAYGFQTVAGAPNTGAYTTVALWTDLTTGLQATLLPGAADTAIIPTGAVCTLDSTNNQTIAGLTVNGALTTKSMLTVAPGGSGTGTTSVASGGSFTVATSDLSGTSSTFETTTLNTASSGISTNFSIEDGATVYVDSAGTLLGNTSVLGDFTAKNIDANSGAAVSLGGTGAISGDGQLDAEVQASFTFAAGSSWAIGSGSPVGSALKAGNFIVDGSLALGTDIEPFGDLTLNPGGTIGGTGTLTMDQTLTWLGGTLTPAGGTVIGGTLTASGAGLKTLGSDLTIDTLDATLGGAGNLLISSGATFLDAFGQVDLSLPMITTNTGGTGMFEVAAGATLNAQASSSSPTKIASNFTNDGYLFVPTGTGLTLDNPGGSVATDLNGELVLESDLTLEGSVSSPLGFLLDAGDGALKIGDGGYITGTLTIPASETATLSGGELEVSSTGKLTGGGAVSNTSGTLAVDIGGSTTGLTSYTQSASGTLDLKAMAADIFSKLAVTGEADLAGTLDLDLLDGYTPSSGTLFTLLTAGTVDNEFNTTPPDMTPTYTSTNVTLTEN